MKNIHIPEVIKEIGITLVIAVALALIIRIFILNAEVNMPSMQNTLFAGQRLLVVKFLGDLNLPHRGDIIILRPPGSTETEYVKRLIGLPGDTVEVKNKKVYLNGVALNEPYIKEAPKYTYGPFTVPENNYFVLGDNRNNSSDSHFGWTVTKENLTGKVWLRYWPLNKFGFIGSYPLDEQLVKN